VFSETKGEVCGQLASGVKKKGGKENARNAHPAFNVSRAKRQKRSRVAVNWRQGQHWTGVNDKFHIGSNSKETSSALYHQNLNRSRKVTRQGSLNPSASVTEDITDKKWII
jgi:hypothetical protein